MSAGALRNILSNLSQTRHPKRPKPDLDSENAQFKQAKAIHLPRSPTTSLKERSMEYFLRQPRLWSQCELLSKSLKNDLLEYLLRSSTLGRMYVRIRNKETLIYEDIHNLIALLLNDTTTTVDLSQFHKQSIWALNRKDVPELWAILEVMVRKAPQVRHLSIYVRYGEKTKIRGRVIDYIKQLPQLQDLKLMLPHFTNININFGSTHLIELATHLPELEYLELNVEDNISKRAICKLKCLTKLKEFRYENSGDDNPLYNLCVNHLRDVHLIKQSSSPVFCCGSSSDESFGLVPIVSGTTRLEHLLSDFQLPEANMPNLKCLQIRGPIKQNPEIFMSRIASYSNLTSLTWVDINSVPGLFPVLELIGHQLSVLLFSGSFELDYFRLFYLCPNVMYLNEISRSMCPLEEDSVFRSKVEKPMFLKKFVSSAHRTIPDGLLKLLLLAPNLETLKLNNVLIRSQDCQVLSDPEIESKGLPNLKFLHMNFIKMLSDSVTKDFEKMIKAFVLLSPKLVRLSTCCIPSPPYICWKKSADFQRYQRLIDKKSCYAQFITEVEWPYGECLQPSTVSGVQRH